MGVLHRIGEDLGPECPFEDAEDWLSLFVDQLEQEIERSFRNHSAFELWLKAHSYD